jgi:phosphoglycolate phosphatase-like HAD superfamily hydrolase
VRIVFDLDNTLVDSFGAEVRPGIVDVLERLSGEGHTLLLWTNSRRDRAVEILRLHDLRRHFAACIFREDYDPEERDVPKDIRRVRGDFLVEDDPKAIAYARSTGKRGFLVRPFRKGAAADREELSRLLDAVSRPKGFFARMLG